MGYGMLQIAGFADSKNSYFKVTGQFLNPARYAMFCAMLFPYVATYKENFKNLWRTVLLFTVGLIFADLIVVSTIQTVWISTIFILAILISEKWRSKGLANLYILLISFLLIAVLIALVSFSDSAQGRVTIWKICGYMIKDNLFFGIGLSNFKNLYSTYQADYFSNHNSNIKEILLADSIRYPYNESLKVICEQGIIGFILVLIFLYFLIAHAVRLIKKSTIFSFNGANFLVLITFAIIGMFSYPSDDISINLVLLFSICFLLANCPTKKTNFTLTPKKIAVIMLFLFPFPISAIKEVMDKESAYKVWKNGTAYYLEAEEIRPLYNLLKNDTRFVLWYVEILLNEKKYQDVIEIVENNIHIIRTPQLYIFLYKAYEALSLFKEAEQTLLTAVNIVPNRFEARYYLMTYYFNKRDFVSCKEQANYILNMPVKINTNNVTKIKEKARQILIEVE